MRNKKGFFIELMGVLAMIILVILFFMVLSDKSDGKNECKQQCEIRNLTYNQFFYGIYTSSTCSCKNINGEIITAYTK